MLPKRIPKSPKRASRWRSQAHLAFVRSHACCLCGSQVNIEAAHVRIGSHAGLGAKPDDFRAASLCAVCHRTGPRAQHVIGEKTFWHGVDVEGLLAAFVRASPKRWEIERVMQERCNGPTPFDTAD